MFLHKNNKQVAKGLHDIYEKYCKTSDEPVEFKVFKEILTKFNCGSMDHLLEGGSLNMGSKLSTLKIVRRKRDPRSQRVDWNTSLGIKKEILREGGKLYNSETGEGEKWLAFFTSERYFKFYWHKEECLIKNKSVYSFAATRGKKGNKERLTSLIKNDDLAYLRFKQHGNL